MVDPELVTRKIRLIVEELDFLEQFDDLDESDYLDQKMTRMGIERSLELLITRLIDINFHLANEELNQVPEDYYESFTMLAELDILDRERAEEVADLAGLRNRLAHEYDTLDESQVYSAFQKLIEELPPILNEIQEQYGKNN